jgi:hypothetical protein
MAQKSIITDKPIVFKTPPASTTPRVGWDVDRFETLIQTQGYDALIDRAYRCPCADKTSGQALSTCRNCLGRGWFFIDRTETRVIAQHMDSKRQYLEWSEVNRGTASITTKGIDKLGFMDRIILTQLEEFYSEILRPVVYNDQLISYPVYEPLKIYSMFLFSSDTTKLIPLDSSMYSVDKNAIIFSNELVNLVNPSSFNVTEMPIAITIRYSHYPVYHVIDVNRELMKVREGKLCSLSDSELRQMPINVTARKAHFIFDAQRWGNEALDNTIFGKERW